MPPLSPLPQTQVAYARVSEETPSPAPVPQHALTQSCAQHTTGKHHLQHVGPSSKEGEDLQVPYRLVAVQELEDRPVQRCKPVLPAALQPAANPRIATCVWGCASLPSCPLLLFLLESCACAVLSSAPLWWSASPDARSCLPCATAPWRRGIVARCTHSLGPWGTFHWSLTLPPSSSLPWCMDTMVGNTLR